MINHPEQLQDEYFLVNATPEEFKHMQEVSKSWIKLRMGKLILSNAGRLKRDPKLKPVFGKIK